MTQTYDDLPEILKDLYIYLRVVGVKSVPRFGLDGIIVEVDDLAKGELIPDFWGENRVILTEGRYDDRRTAAE